MFIKRSTGGLKSATLVAMLIALTLLSSPDYLPNASSLSGGLLPNLQTTAVTPIQQFSLTEWGVPTPGGGPWGIGVDQNGNTWITENATNKLASFNPANNSFTEWNIPTVGSQPRNIFTTQISGVTRVFFTEYSSNKIARFDTSRSNFTEWQLPVGSNPVGIYVDENNDIWFTESGRDIIGRLNPSTSNLTEWTLPGATSTPGSPSLKPWGIYLQVVTSPLGGNNRFVWFSELLGNKIGRLEANSNRLTLWDLTSFGFGSYQPTDIASGVINTLPVTIFVNINSNKISILGNDTGGGSVYQESPIPTNSAKPSGVVFDASRNAIWFAENSVGGIANLNATSAFVPQLVTASYCTILPAAGSPSCASPAARTFGLVAATAHAGVAGISQVQAPLTTTVNLFQGPLSGVSEYRLPNVTSRPTFLALASGGALWFTESNVTVNRIGRFSIPYVFQVSASPSVQTVNKGQTATYAVSVALLAGNSLPLQLSLLSAPTGVTPQFAPQTFSPPFTSTLTIVTTNATPTGTFPMIIQAISGGQTQSSAITLIVGTPPPPAFDYTITVTSIQTVTIPQGGSASFNVTVTRISGSTQLVNLTATGLPPGTHYSFTIANAAPNFMSMLNVQTDPNTPAGSYPIIITGISTGGVTRNPAQGPVLTMTELLRDFNLTSSVSQVILVQASRVDATLTAVSIGAFTGSVTFSGQFSPSVQGLTVTFSPQSVILESNGGIGQVTMEIVAQKNTPGTYVLTVKGTSGTPSRTHQITMNVRVSPCIIATATFGSELAPEVEFLRDFRDQQIMNTFAGSNFMNLFNAWYYSFSPAVAQYEYLHATMRTIVKLALYPVIGILRLASSSFTLIGFEPEFAALVAGLVASTLIGLVYFSLPISTILWLSRKRIDTKTRRRLARGMAATLAVMIAGFVVSEIFTLPAAMMLASASLVLTALAAGSVLPALKLAERFGKNV